MFRKAQPWWYDGSQFMPSMLSPVSALWTAGFRLRQILARPYRSTLPVICVGNLTAGGAGKTPVALAIGRHLQQSGSHPVFLTRGYGGRKQGPHVVDPDRDPAMEVGDEPLLLSRVAPVIVSANRARGARLAEKLGADVIVMDDGFQNPQLEKSLSLLVIDRATGIGNGRVMPAGPLRAPLNLQLPWAKAVIAIGEGSAAEGVIARARETGATIFDATLKVKSNPAWLTEKPVIAFAGIGNPDKFFSTLAACGADIAERIPFDDHHPFTRAEAEELMLKAKDARAHLVTTEKDLARLTGRNELELFRQNVKALPVRLQFRDRGKLKRLLARALGKT